MQHFTQLNCHFIRKIRRLTDFNYFTREWIAILAANFSCPALDIFMLNVIGLSMLSTKKQFCSKIDYFDNFADQLCIYSY
jgi:hypothetical protein